MPGDGCNVNIKALEAFPSTLTSTINPQTRAGPSKMLAAQKSSRWPLELFPGLTASASSAAGQRRLPLCPPGEGSSRGPRKLFRRLRPRLASAVNSLADGGAQICDPEARRPGDSRGGAKNESFIACQAALWQAMI